MSRYQLLRTLSGISKPQKSSNNISLARAHINTERYFKKAGILFFSFSSLISLGIIYNNDLFEPKSWSTTFSRFPK